MRFLFLIVVFFKEKLKKNPAFVRKGGKETDTQILFAFLTPFHEMQTVTTFCGPSKGSCFKCNLHFSKPVIRKRKSNALLFYILWGGIR